MDPLTAFSVFCNIITTVEAAVKTGKELKQLYDATSGLTGNHERVERSAAQLRKIAGELDTARRTLPSGSQQQPLFVDIAKECKDVTDKIDAILVECRVDDRGPKLVAVFKATVRTRRRKSELDRLLSEMESAAKRLGLSIAVASQADLETLKDQVYKCGVQQTELVERLSSIKNDLVSQKDLLANVQRLAVAFDEGQTSIRHAAILKALRPSVLDAREDVIKHHHPRTFGWILNLHDDGESSRDSGSDDGGESSWDSDSDDGGESPRNSGSDDGGESSWDSDSDDDEIRTRPTKDREPDVGFVKWLVEGSGVYHVAGKPGSGKSTLMKFLANEPVVRSHLEKWAASAGKKLVLAKFFFWKYGSDDQRSVRGLLRGLLYGMSRDSPCLTKALFPQLWGDTKSWQLPVARELTLNSSDIGAAFDKLRINEDIRQQFRVCLFIDGLDEFDGKDMSHSKLASKVKAWTDSPDSASFIKVCVSSREEHPIMSAFPAPQRIHLQDLTRDDISALVRSTLGASEPFLALQKGNEYASKTLLASIVADAQGVFLWVALLLNLLEDELCSGISSISALQNIVWSVPKELEEFLRQILESIPNHHQHGAYFVLSMALRMLGYHLSEKGTFDKTEQAIHETWFRRATPRWWWQSGLSIYEVGKVLGEFEKRNHSFDAWSWPTWVTTQEYMDEAHKAAGKIRSWCKGLLDVPDPCLPEAGPLLRLDTNFAHRAIPDFLAAAMPAHAHKFGFDDEDVARGILAVAIAQTLSTDRLYGDTDYTKPPTLNEQVLALLRLRQIPQHSRIPQLLDRLDVARLEARQRLLSGRRRTDSHPDNSGIPKANPSTMKRSDQNLLHFSPEGFADVLAKDDIAEAQGSRNAEWGEKSSGLATLMQSASRAGLFEYAQWKLSRDPEFKRNPKELSVGLHGLWWSSVLGHWSHAHTSLLHLLLAVASPHGLQFPKNHRENAEGSFAMAPKQMLISGPGYLARRLEAGFADVCSEHHDVVWFWCTALSTLLEHFVWRVPARTFLWEILEVWLEHGATPPLGVRLGLFSYEEWKARRAERRAKRARWAGKWAAPPLRSVPPSGDSDLESTDESATSSNSDSEEEEEYPVGYILFRLPVTQNGTTSSSVDMLDVQIRLLDTNRHTLGGLIPHLQTSGAVTLADLVRYHNPPNAKTLLGYIDRSQALRDEHASLHDDRVFASDGFNVARIMASKRAMIRRLREEELTRESAGGPTDADSP